jgi:hypothetical protein
VAVGGEIAEEAVDLDLMARSLQLHEMLILASLESSADVNVYCLLQYYV